MSTYHSSSQMEGGVLEKITWSSKVQRQHEVELQEKHHTEKHDKFPAADQSLSNPESST